MNLMDDWAKYRASALETAPDHDSHMEQLQQGIIGMIGEVAEYHHDPSLPEAGDVWWYLAMIDDAMLKMSMIDYSFMQKMPSDVPERQLFSVIGEVANSFEKVCYQDLSDIEALTSNIRQVFLYMLLETSRLPAAWWYNLEKLGARHGEEFSSYDEQNRK